jgi:hypothetical protein
MSTPVIIDLFVLWRDSSQEEQGRRSEPRDARARTLGRVMAGMTESIAGQDPFDLTGVRDHQDYARALAALAEQGRRERWVALLSSTEAHVVAELLGQYAQREPTAELNQLAATLAARLYSRLGV